MRQAVREIDVTEMPEVIRLVEQVRAAGEPVRLVRAGEQLALLDPSAAARSTGQGEASPSEAGEASLFGWVIGIGDSTDSVARPEERPANGEKAGSVSDESHDPLLDIIGMFSSDGPGDVSENKYKYLAEAYADPHEDAK